MFIKALNNKHNWRKNDARLLCVGPSTGARMRRGFCVLASCAFCLNYDTSAALSTGSIDFLIGYD